MPFWIPAAIGAAATLLGGERANKQSARQAQLSMDFEERMSNTAHQREVADLRAAGLNPILSGTGGAGSSTPSGSMGDVQDTIGPAVASAQELTRMRQELRNARETERLLRSQREKTDWEAVTAKHNSNIAFENSVINKMFGVDQASSALEAARIDNEIRKREIPAAQIKSELWSLGGEAGAKLLEMFGSGTSARRMIERLRSLGSLP